MRGQAQVEEGVGELPPAQVPGRRLKYNLLSPQMCALSRGSV